MGYRDFVKTARGGGIGNDTIGAGLWSGGTLGLSSLFGKLHGIAKGPASDEELEEMDEHPGRSWAPGVGASRQARKTLTTAKASKNPRTLVASELFGSLTSAAPVMAAATLIGAALAPKRYFRMGDGSIGAYKNTRAGAATGAMVGAGAIAAAHMLAAILAKTKKRRTTMEQDKLDRESGIGLKNWLIPGVGMYNRLKRKDLVQTQEDSRNNNAELRDTLKALVPYMYD